MKWLQNRHAVTQCKVIKFQPGLLEKYEKEYNKEIAAKCGLQDNMTLNISHRYVETILAMEKEGDLKIIELGSDYYRIQLDKTLTDKNTSPKQEASAKHVETQDERLTYAGLSLNTKTGKATYGKTKHTFRMKDRPYKFLHHLMKSPEKKITHDSMAKELSIKLTGDQLYRVLSYVKADIKKALDMKTKKTKTRKNKDLIFCNNGYMLIND